jgi:hypothetical protein
MTNFNKLHDKSTNVSFCDKSYSTSQLKAYQDYLITEIS